MPSRETGVSPPTPTRATDPRVRPPARRVQLRIRETSNQEQGQQRPPEEENENGVLF